MTSTDSPRSHVKRWRCPASAARWTAGIKRCRLDDEAMEPGKRESPNCACGVCRQGLEQRGREAEPMPRRVAEQQRRAEYSQNPCHGPLLLLATQAFIGPVLDEHHPATRLEGPPNAGQSSRYALRAPAMPRLANPPRPSARVPCAECASGWRWPGRRAWRLATPEGCAWVTVAAAQPAALCRDGMRRCSWADGQRPRSEGPLACGPTARCDASTGARDGALPTRRLIQTAA